MTTISGRSGEYFKSDKVLWIAAFALLAAGLVMVYSSSFIFAQEKFKDGLYFFKRHFAYMGIGTIAFIIGWRIKPKQLKKITLPLLITTITFLICTKIPGLNHKVGGASRWVSFFGFNFQPSELAKLSVILYVATQLDRKVHLVDNWRTGFLTYFLGVMPIYVLLLLQPDFGTTALLLFVTFFMLFSCGAKLRYLFITVLTLIPAGVLLILTSPYRKARLLGFIDPWSDPAHKGFQVIQSFIAFYSGKWFGVGLGNSREKLFYLPEAHNDFIFSVVGEELGLFGVLLFIGLFLVIILRGLKVAERLDTAFVKAVAIGITSLIGLQAFFNMGVVLGLLPTKGLPLPLISYGGTALIVMMLMLGILTGLSEREA